MEERPGTTSSSLQSSESEQQQDIQALNERIEKESEFIDLLVQEIERSIVGQKHMIQRLLIGLLSNGHILLEGVPGLAKTLAINSLSKTIDVDFKRIQFTPDLLPADLVGTMIYEQHQQSFEVKKGPVFSNFLLADEVNRAPAKVQSALLEGMQERQVTIGDRSYELPEPFMVLATQNPIEQEGTYPLPEAQVDRFMLKVVLDYPEKEEERRIIHQNLSPEAHSDPQKVVDPEKIQRARKTLQEVYMDEKIERYIVDLVHATREPQLYGMDELQRLIGFGGSPRASINMAQAAKAYAFIQHRGYTIPEDVRAVCHDVLRHRVGLSFEAEAEEVGVDELIDRLLNTVEVP
ncbi:MAG: AAA family ATPase [Flavobacteriales bacterium]